mgnify:CR=1 FL=1
MKVNLEKNIILRLKQGDSHAFKWVYEKFSDKIFSVARNFGLSIEDAEEVVQDVFVKIWQRSADLKVDLSFNAYLLTISKSIMIKKLRNHHTRFMMNTYFDQKELSVDQDVEQLLEYNDLLDLMDRILGQLPQQQQEVFRLAKMHRLPKHEIAQRLNISDRTVENHLYRALITLRKNLKEAGVENTWIYFFLPLLIS